MKNSAAYAGSGSIYQTGKPMYTRSSVVIMTENTVSNGSVLGAA